MPKFSRVECPDDLSSRLVETRGNVAIIFALDTVGLEMPLGAGLPCSERIELSERGGALPETFVFRPSLMLRKALLLGRPETDARLAQLVTRSSGTPWRNRRDTLD